MKVNEIKALQSLKGLSIGDALGEKYFGLPGKVLPAIEKRILPAADIWRYTDDTQMAISIVDSLLNKGRINQDYLAEKFCRRMESERGYGRNVAEFVQRVRAGENWRGVSASAFNGKGSFGNGSAMRVAPLGAYFHNDFAKVIENARLSAEVTHDNIEAIAGAIAVAMAAACAAVMGKDFHRKKFFSLIVNAMPESRTRDGVTVAEKIPGTEAVESAAGLLGSGREISCQDTVPFVLWSIANNIHDFEAAFWNTVRGLGDRDTTCAMVCGVVALSTGNAVPAEWIKRTERLPIEFEL